MSKWRPGDWHCNICNFNIFGKKDKCFKCGLLKSQWCCNNCKYISDEKKLKCPRCDNFNSKDNEYFWIKENCRNKEEYHGGWVKVETDVWWKKVDLLLCDKARMKPKILRDRIYYFIKLFEILLDDFVKLHPEYNPCSSKKCCGVARTHCWKHS